MLCSKSSTHRAMLLVITQLIDFSYFEDLASLHDRNCQLCVSRNLNFIFLSGGRTPLSVRWISRKSLCAVWMSSFAKGALLRKIVRTSLLRIASQHMIAVTKEFGQTLCRHYKHKNAIMESSLFSPVDLAQRKGHLNWYQCQCMSWIFNGFLLVGLTIWGQVEYLRASVLY